MEEKPFAVEVARQGRALCKKCRQKCVQGDLRIAKLIPNPLGSGKMKTWYHVSCIFETFLKQRQTTKRIEGPLDIDGWESLDPDDKVNILEKISQCNREFEAKFSKKRPKKGTKPQPQLVVDDNLSNLSDNCTTEEVHKDNCFREFRRIVSKLPKVSSSNEKISIFREIFTKGCDGSGFKGDVVLWCKLLLPAVNKRVFHLQTKQLIKIFSKIFAVSEETMTAHLEQGDVGQTIQHFFEENAECKPAKKSTLSLFEVDDFLESLTTLSKEEDQCNRFKTFIKKCTANDLKVVIRLIKHDLRMSAGAKHVFNGLHPEAYSVFQTCKDIATVISTCQGRKEPPKKRRKISEEKRKSIPNYFENVRLFLEEGVKERHAQWVKYFIAYGGSVLTNDKPEEATHVLHLKDTISQPTIHCANSAKHVIVEWIKDTVAEENLQDYRRYTVRWDPCHKD
ncbi:DNA ligase 3 [Tribolium castaneum]|uniref:DNA ligase 3-like Protein n=1 Tax=Tribolium castaneum TaxID=7070 RepID=D6WBL1_TRICA|nr:PREDICTED: DNA ligase 3 [Tribolium castaneum]XP_015839105.1 PREDICTED: DNA ligase 3 [Tribolium castaneum]EEZ98905.1 DNA ligase 3-like Protein [Tribolium castaneum]|eukprot:XP_001809442.1 PREDICTED: DNA ligase 3 [Tribolium castaneum]